MSEANPDDKDAVARSQSRSPSPRSFAVLRRVLVDSSKPPEAEPVVRPKRSLILYRKVSSTKNEPVRPRPGAGASLPRCSQSESRAADLKEKKAPRRLKKRATFLTKRRFEACLPKHSWFEPRPKVDRIVGLTIHCFALSMVVLLTVGARLLVNVTQLLCSMAIHSSVERGQLVITSLSKEQVRQSSICKVGDVYVILARVDGHHESITHDQLHHKESTQMHIQQQQQQQQQQQKQKQQDQQQHKHIIDPRRQLQQRNPHTSASRVSIAPSSLTLTSSAIERDGFAEHLRGAGFSFSEESETSLDDRGQPSISSHTKTGASQNPDSASVPYKENIKSFRTSTVTSTSPAAAVVAVTSSRVHTHSHTITKPPGPSLSPSPVPIREDSILLHTRGATFNKKSTCEQVHFVDI